MLTSTPDEFLRVLKSQNEGPRDGLKEWALREGIKRGPKGSSRKRALKERAQDRELKIEGSRERAQERELKRKLKSDLNKAFKGQSLKRSEPCPVGACLIHFSDERIKYVPTIF